MQKSTSRLILERNLKAKAFKTKIMKTTEKDEALKKLESLKADFDKQSAELKKIIEGKPRSIKERVFDIPSAIIELGENHPDVKEYRILQKSGCSIKTLRGQEITIFCKAMNEGVVMSWKNENTKYFPWFDTRKPVKKGFFISGCDSWRYYACSLSSGHAYVDSDKALHGSECIEQTYYDYLMND